MSKLIQNSSKNFQNQKIKITSNFNFDHQHHPIQQPQLQKKINIFKNIITSHYVHANMKVECDKNKSDPLCFSLFEFQAMKVNVFCCADNKIIHEQNF